MAGNLGRVERAVVRAAAGLVCEPAFNPLHKNGVVNRKLYGCVELGVFLGQQLVQLSRK